MKHKILSDIEVEEINNFLKSPCEIFKMSETSYLINCGGKQYSYFTNTKHLIKFAVNVSEYLFTPCPEFRYVCDIVSTDFIKI